MKRRRKILLVVGIGLLIGAVFFAKPVLHLLWTAARDVDELEDPPPGHLDDASRLNQTAIAEIWDIPVDSESPERQLAELLTRARAEGRRVSIAGARHSMGGHTIYPGGIAINMLPWHGMELDEDREILKVQAGALWKDVIAYLDGFGRSVGVMQSNNSFSVGGSISVNCHGWAYDRPPIASTVESFRLMKADGTIVECSREENRELFSIALGGYGLFGIILDVELRVVPNQRYRLKRFVVPVTDALTTLDSSIEHKAGLQMVYARMNVAPEKLLEEVILNAFFIDSGGTVPPLTDPGLDRFRRTMFRGSEGSDYGKELRWSAEAHLQPLLSGEIFSRNRLLNEEIEVFENRSADTTDILHEYFVPHDRVGGFLEATREIVRRHDADLLNVTIRLVNEDTDTFLRYADQPMIAFVMLFVQERTDLGEERMEALTGELIDAAIAHEGRFYLPYRLHATQPQLLRAYPRIQEFFERKRKYDPGELFQNRFYLKYGRPTRESDPAHRGS